LTNYG